MPVEDVRADRGRSGAPAAADARRAARRRSGARAASPAPGPSARTQPRCAGSGTVTHLGRMSRVARPRRSSSSRATSAGRLLRLERDDEQILGRRDRSGWRIIVGLAEAGRPGVDQPLDSRSRRPTASARSPAADSARSARRRRAAAPGRRRRAMPAAIRPKTSRGAERMLRRRGAHPRQPSAKANSS